MTRYLIKYVASPPIAVSRIIAYDGQSVELGLRWCCGRSGRQLAALFIIRLMTLLNGEK